MPETSISAGDWISAMGINTSWFLAREWFRGATSSLGQVLSTEVGFWRPGERAWICGRGCHLCQAESVGGPEVVGPGSPLQW